MRLERDRQINVLVAVILIRDVDVMTGPNIVADFDREVTDDSARSTDQTPVTDLHYRRCEARLARDHPGGQRNLRADHGVAAYFDITLIKDRGEWMANDASLSESCKFPPPRRIGTDRAVDLDPFGETMDCIERTRIDPSA